jgi:hypothetical protein
MAPATSQLQHEPCQWRRWGRCLLAVTSKGTLNKYLKVKGQKTNLKLFLYSEINKILKKYTFLFEFFSLYSTFCFERYNFGLD